MNMNNYTFRFKSGEVMVRAFNYANACILAQAEAIKNGWDCAIINCHSDEVHMVLN